MPGSEVTSPPTTRFNDGTAVISRSTRSMRSARSTENGPVAGTSAIPTTMSRTGSSRRGRRQAGST